MRSTILALMLLTSFAQSAPVTVPVCGVKRVIDRDDTGACTRVYFSVGSRRFSGLLVSHSRAIGKAQVMIDDCNNEVLDVVVISLRQIYKAESVSCYNQ